MTANRNVTINFSTCVSERYTSKCITYCLRFDNIIIITTTIITIIIIIIIIIITLCIFYLSLLFSFGGEGGWEEAGFTT